MSARTQKELVLEYLETHENITPMDALNKFGCFRLAAIICELRKDGHDIDMKLNDGAKRYGIYSLKKDEVA